MSLRHNYDQILYVKKKTNKSNVTITYLIGHQNLFSSLTVIAGGRHSSSFSFGINQTFLALESNIIHLNEFIDFFTLFGHLFIATANHKLQLIFYLDQFGQHFGNGSFAQNTTDQTKAFPILVDRFQCINDGSVKSKKNNLILFCKV